jgi:hypothetical protein
MFLRCCLAVAMFAVCSATAQADTFELDASFEEMSSGALHYYEIVTGPITIDTTMGTVTAADLTVSVYLTRSTILLGTEEIGGAGDIVYQEPVTYSGGLPPGSPPQPTYYTLEISDLPGQYMTLNFPVASLVGYSGGVLCRGSNCPTYFGGIDSYLTYNFDGLSASSDGLIGGTLTPEATAVPEPSTLTLIATGVIGIAGAFRRQQLARLARKPTTP